MRPFLSSLRKGTSIDGSRTNLKAGFKKLNESKEDIEKRNILIKVTSEVFIAVTEKLKSEQQAPSKNKKESLDSVLLTGEELIHWIQALGFADSPVSSIQIAEDLFKFGYIYFSAEKDRNATKTFQITSKYTLVLGNLPKGIKIEYQIPNLTSNNRYIIASEEDKRWLLKIISKNDEESYDNLKNEIYLLRKYENSFFPKFHLLCKNQSSYIALFQAPRGGNLYERLINEYPVKERVVIELIKKITKGLAYLHKRSYVFRSLSLSGIYIVEEGPLHEGSTVVAINAENISRLDELKPLQRYSVFTAPEFYSNGSITPLVDIWSLGIIVYWLLIGLYSPYFFYPPFSFQFEIFCFSIS